MAFDDFYKGGIHNTMNLSNFLDDKLNPGKSVQDVSKTLHNYEAINHPAHYNTGKIETIDCIEAMLSQEEFIGYLKGNVLKYVARERTKGGFQDLLKAEWYYNKLMSTLRERKNK